MIDVQNLLKPRWMLRVALKSNQLSLKIPSKCSSFITILTKLSTGSEI